MRKLKFFELVLSLMVVGLVACDKGYDAKVIKLSDMTNQKGYYAPTSGTPNTVYILSFMTAEEMRAMASSAIKALITDDNATYAILLKMSLTASPTNISYECFAKVESSKLELLAGALGYSESDFYDIAKSSLKLEVTKADGSELKLSGTINCVDPKYSEKVDLVYTYTGAKWPEL